MTVHEFDVVVSAGRFDATPAQVKAAWQDFRARGASIILTSEYGSGNFDDVIAAPGWAYFREHGECVVAWASDVFGRAWKDAGHTDQLGTTFVRGYNTHARTPLASVPLSHLATGRLGMVRMSHLPAHIQTGDRLERSTPRLARAALAWVTALRALGSRVRRFEKHHPGSWQVVAADFNVNVHRLHWRTVVGRVLGLRVFRPLPKGGDLGARLITWGATCGLEVVETELLPKCDGLDHRPVRIRFRIKEKKP